MRELELALGVKPRGLQGQDGVDGPIDVAAREIYREEKVYLITASGKGGGAMLTNDLGRVRHARNKLGKHIKGEQHRLHIYDTYLLNAQTTLMP